MQKTEKVWQCSAHKLCYNQWFVCKFAIEKAFPIEETAFCTNLSFFPPLDVPSYAFGRKKMPSYTILLPLLVWWRKNGAGTLVQRIEKVRECSAHKTYCKVTVFPLSHTLTLGECPRDSSFTIPRGGGRVFLPCPLENILENSGKSIDINRCF